MNLSSSSVSSTFILFTLILVLSACTGPIPFDPGAGTSITTGNCTVATDQVREYLVSPSGNYQTIQQALTAAESVDEPVIIKISKGIYHESIAVERSQISLCGQGSVVVTNSHSDYGLKITGDEVSVQNVTVRNITREVFPSDFGPSGIVVSGNRISLVNVESYGNAVNGLVILGGASEVHVSGGRFYDNRVAGIGLGGGSRLEVNGAEIFATSSEAQQYGILSDNVGDTQGSGDNIQSIDDSQPLSHITIHQNKIYGHHKYGIRISVENQDRSQLPSGRITTRELVLSDNEIFDNGSALDDFVGGLYHHGNVLLQHIEKGRIEGNEFRGGYTWGIDIYGSNNLNIRHNLFINNDRGQNTEGVTIAPYGVEINGGRNNRFENNLVYGNTNGLFSSFFPDSGDQFDHVADSLDSYDGTFSLTVNKNILVNNHGQFISDEGNSETGVDYEYFSHQVTITFENNVLHRIPDFLGADPGVLETDFAQSNPHYRLPLEELFVDAARGDFTIRSTSPIYGKNIGPRQIQGSAAAHRITNAYFAGHSGINDAIPTYTALLSRSAGLEFREKHCQIGGGFLDWQFDQSGQFPCNQWEDFPGSGPMGEEFISNKTHDYDAVILVENSSYGDLREQIQLDTTPQTTCADLANVDLLNTQQRRQYVQTKIWGGEGDPWTSPGFMQMAYDVAKCHSSPSTRLYFFNHWDDDFGKNPQNLTTPGVYRQQLQSWADYWQDFVEKLNRPNIRIIPAARALERLIASMEDGTAPGFQGALYGANQNLSWANYLVHGDNIHLTNVGIYFLSLVTYSTLHEVSPEGLPIPTNEIGESLIAHNSFGGNDGVLVEDNTQNLSLDWRADSRGNIYINSELRLFMQRLAWQVVQEQISADYIRGDR